jgi:hypothetical protein
MVMIYMEELILKIICLDGYDARSLNIRSKSAAQIQRRRSIPSNIQPDSGGMRRNRFGNRGYGDSFIPVLIKASSCAG